MSERICCVVASPKTESRSAAAVAVIANTTMSWSVKSTVSIMDLHTLNLSQRGRTQRYCSNLLPWLKMCLLTHRDNSGTGYVFLPTYAGTQIICGQLGNSAGVRSDEPRLWDFLCVMDGWRVPSLPVASRRETFNDIHPDCGGDGTRILCSGDVHH
jgi:hypothetical protein